MTPEVLEAHLVPMRPETWRGFEPIVQHEALEPCLHGEPCKELQGDAQFMKLKKFEPGERLSTYSHQDCKVQWNERRVFKLLNLAGHGDAVSVGLPRHEPKDLGEPETVRVMPSTDARGRQGMRNCSRKLATAEMYSSKWHRRGRSGSHGSSSEVDYTALAEAMRGL